MLRYTPCAGKQIHSVLGQVGVVFGYGVPSWPGWIAELKKESTARQAVTACSNDDAVTTGNGWSPEGDEHDASE